MTADPSNPPSLSGTAGARPPTAAIAGAIRKAARATGASFEYLLATAKVESNLDPATSAKNSTASGLFQFIEQTWLSTLRQAGKALGYGRYAAAIGQTPAGRYEVRDPALRSQVMALRKDPSAAAAVGGAFTQQNSIALSRRLGRAPSESELYIAHFLGAGAAARVIRLTGDDPHANAAELFPAAAQANRSIFYDKAGNTRSVAGVYAELTRRYQLARAMPTPGIVTTANDVRPAPGPAPAILDTAAITSAFADAAEQPSVRLQAGPIFHSLFHSDERRGAIAPAVADLWGVGAARAGTETSGSVPAPTPIVPTTPANGSATAAPLDLFQELRPNVRALFDGSV